MDEIKTPAFIDEHGKLQLQHRDSFAATIACFPNHAGTLIFEPHKNRISHNQRKYFFGVIVDLLEAFFTSTGVECTKQDVLDLLKQNFLFREKLCPITNKYMRVPISMSDSEGGMDMKEFTEKKDAIQKWGAEVLKIEIPDPDKNWRMHKKEKEDKNDRANNQS